MMKLTPYLFLWLFFFLGLGCSIENKEDLIDQKVIHLLDSLLQHSELESLSVGIIQKGKQRTYYKGHLLNGEAPDANTLFEIASITKTFTGTLVAHAVTENKINIDQSVLSLLSGEFNNLAYDSIPVSVKHVLCHQGGLPNMFPNQPEIFDNPDWDQLPFQINELQKDFSEDDFFKELKAVKLDTFPGLTFNYSNAGANLLGYVLENSYQKPFEQLLFEKILHPLKMSQTSIDLGDLDKQQLAKGQNQNGIEMPIRSEKDMNAEGGIFSTLPDMNKYMAFHLDNQNPVINTAHQPLWNGQFGDFDTGFFWQINKDGAQPDRIFQNGGAFGTSSWMMLLPEKELGIFLVTNLAGPEVHQKLSETCEQLIQLLR